MINSISPSSQSYAALVESCVNAKLGVQEVKWIQWHYEKRAQGEQESKEQCNKVQQIDLKQCKITKAPLPDPPDLNPRSRSWKYHPHPSVALVSVVPAAVLAVSLVALLVPGSVLVPGTVIILTCSLLILSCWLLVYSRPGTVIVLVHSGFGDEISCGEDGAE